MLGVTVTVAPVLVQSSEAADAFKNYLAKAPDAKDKKDIEDEIYYLSK